MPHPTQGYRNAAGEKIPGTTTIIGRFKESGGLLHWATGQGRDIEKRALWEQAVERLPDCYHKLFGDKEPPAIYHLYDKRDEAADIGTIVHSMVEKHIKGADPTPPDYVLNALTPGALEQVQSGYNAYRKWESMTRLVIVEQEMSLVSEEYQFGGTPDAIGEIGGELCLLDWKTSSGVYQDYLVQLAAYSILWHENHPDRPLVGGFHLCRFSKEHGDFSHHYWQNLDDAKEQFILFRRAFDLDKRLKKRAA